MKFISNIFYVLFLLVIVSCSPSENETVENGYLKAPEWSYDATIYEVNVRQYSDEGTFAAFEKEIPRLKEMGIEILWFMPIHPIGEKNRKGTLGSYYAVKDYKAVNPEFGTPEDFKSVVNTAHSNGMKVIIDWVANHTAWDNVWTVTRPEYFNTDSTGSFYPPVPDWEDVIDLNYDNKELWAEMTDAMEFWVREANIDGYRCDVASMVPTDFWNNVYAELNKIKPVFMLAESDAADLHENAFHMSYDWNFMNLMQDIYNGDKNAFAIEEHYKSDKAKYPENAFRMRFVTNHDENSWHGTVFERYGDAAEMFSALICVFDGMPLVYSGQEAGMDKRLEFFEKDPIEWKDHEFKTVFTKLLNLKQRNKALMNGVKSAEVNFIETSQPYEVLSFVREKDGDKVFVIMNMSANSVSVNVTDKSAEGSYINTLTGESVTISTEESIALGGWSYLILSVD